MTQKTEDVKLDGITEPVQIWKLNYGFGTDIEDFFSEIKQSASGQDVTIKPGKVRLAWLAFGIYECKELGIPQPKSLEDGLSDAELKQRLRAVRKLNRKQGAELYDKILELNNSKETSGAELEEIQKKQ